MKPYGKNFNLSLNQKEINRLKKGKDVIKTYHENLKPLPLFVVVLSKKKYNKKDLEVFLKAGDDATSIQLPDKEIERLENDFNHVLKVGYSRFNIFIYSEQAEIYNLIERSY